MCVSIPSRVVHVGERSATSITGRVSVAGSEVTVDLIMVPNAVVGDHVVIHSGYAIEIIPEDRAKETIELLDSIHVQEMEKADPSPRPPGG
jgi:hydrogenase expression/formation protein HypC